MIRTRVLSGCIVVFVVSVVLAAAASAATGVTLRVTVTTDTDATGVGACFTGGRCSLREAVNQADADGGDLIIIPAATYTLSPAHGPMVLSADATVEGSTTGETTISGDSGTRIFTIDSPAVLAMTDLTLQNGRPSSGPGGAVLVSSGARLSLSDSTLSSNSAPGGGGAIASEGGLELTDSTVTENSSPAGGGGVEVANVTTGTAMNVSTTDISGTTISNNAASDSGGGIEETNSAADPSATDSLTVTDSTVSGNASGGSGGGIADGVGARTDALVVTNSTISGNITTANGGGVSVGGNPGVATFLDDTVAANSALTSAATGGDVHVAGTPKPSFEDTIIASGTSSSGADCDGTVTSAGHNLDDADGCGFSMATDLTNANPKLGTLQDNGGPADTMAIAAGSPAADAGGGNGLPATDERGVTRPQGLIDDIGAFEFAPPILGRAGSGKVSATGASLGVVVNNPDPKEGAVTFQYGTTTAYGSETPPVALAAETITTSGSVVISGLNPGTVYHYRATALDTDGTVDGPDQTFETPAAQPFTKQPANQFTLGTFTISKRGKLTAKLGIPSAGRIHATAALSAKSIYGSEAVKSRGRSTVKLVIAPSRSAAAALRRVSRVNLTIVVTFTPTGGSARTKSVKVTLRRDRHGNIS